MLARLVYVQRLACWVGHIAMLAHICWFFHICLRLHIFWDSCALQCRIESSDLQNLLLTPLLLIPSIHPLLLRKIRPLTQTKLFFQSPKKTMATPHNVVDPIEADEFETDPGLDVRSLASSTTSVTSSILRGRRENGRTYHAYKEGAYAVPQDEIEQDRLGK